MAARGSSEERAALARAKTRLDRLDFHPRPVSTARTRIWHAPWLFRAPWFRRFDGYESCEQIFIRTPLGEVSDDLICHELCHVWQEQHDRLGHVAVLPARLPREPERARGAPRRR